nr:SRPBCC family protein [Marinicella sp. W31]MDC2879094.1 SRPBCC family protein [Marinicella sp. W31]
MTGNADPYAALIEPATLKIERLLPGPVERVWAYLIESDKRRQWLAAGDMVPQAGTPFELVWRNDELGEDPQDKAGHTGEVNRMESHIIELHAPYRLVFAWGEHGEVAIDLEPKGANVLLTLVHTRISDRRNKVDISAGWHRHLDILVARLSGKNPDHSGRNGGC